MSRWPLHKTYFWESAPFFRALLPFAAGILCYDIAPVPPLTALIAALACTALLAAIVFRQKAVAAYRYLTFAALNLLFFSGACAVAGYADVRTSSAWYGHHISAHTTALVRVSETPVEKETSWKLQVTALYNIADDKAIPAAGNALVYVHKGRLPVILHKGDTILMPANWQPIKNTGNPFAFNYAVYSRRNNIYHRQFCKAEDIRLYAANDPDAAPIAEKAHNWCMAQLGSYITDTTAKGLLQAMLLGDEANLDDGLRQSYAETGVVHIIAISGGNVTVFFIIISALLYWLSHKKHLWIKYLIALPIVWFYVVMAGASPSAIRAAMMFSLFALALLLDKNSNSLNQLFATAFLLLCSQPAWLFSVGFQLSFVAVLSLILFFDQVNGWVRSGNKIIKKCWSTVAAGIAAEVLVAPLVVYYFHTFPLLFIIANFVAFIFMGVVLVLGMCIIAFSGLSAVAAILGTITGYLVAVFNNVVARLQQLNPTSFHLLTLTTAQLVLYYIAISAITFFLIRKYKPALFGGLAAFCILLGALCFSRYYTLQQHRLVVYNVPGASHVELINGDKYAVLATDTGAGKKTRYATLPAHIGWQAWQEDRIAQGSIYLIAGKTVLILNNDVSPFGHFPVDYLVVNFSGTPDFAQLAAVFSPSVIVTRGNVAGKTAEEWQRQVPAGIKLHLLSLSGSLIID